MSVDKVSFCLDICVGYGEDARENLIGFLREKKPVLNLTTAERGMWQGVKLLRIHTAESDKLREYIEREYRLGDDCEYEVHFTEIDARRCMTYLPDYDSAHGYETFDL